MKGLQSTPVPEVLILSRAYLHVSHGNYSGSPPLFEIYELGLGLRITLPDQKDLVLALFSYRPSEKESFGRGLSR